MSDHLNVSKEDGQIHGTWRVNQYNASENFYPTAQDISEILNLLPRGSKIRYMDINSAESKIAISIFDSIYNITITFQLK